MHQRWHDFINIKFGSSRTEMVVKWTFFIGIYLALSPVFGQFEPLNPGLEWGAFPKMGAEYYTKNSIKTVQTTVMIKAPSKKLVSNRQSDRLHYSTEGMLISHWRVNALGDTALTNYHFDEESKLVKENFADGFRKESTQYLYSEKNEVIELKVKDEVKLEEISTEKFRYEFDYEGQVKKYWLNTEGLSYKYAILKMDDRNRVIQEHHRYIRGTKREDLQYVYSGELLTQFVKVTRNSPRFEEKFDMKYDVNGTLLEMDEYHDGTLHTHFEYLYEEGLLTAILEKDSKTQHIKITKISYEFYSK